MKQDIDAPTEILDLLKQRETVVVADSKLQMTDGLRFTYESRMDALRGEFGLWLQQH